MLTFEDVMIITGEIKYKDWTLHLIRLNDSSCLLQWMFQADEGLQLCREWYIPYEMTPSEVVLTALKAVVTAEEHEAREAFRYKGSRVFGPHIDLDKLVDLAKYKENLSLRV